MYKFYIKIPPAHLFLIQTFLIFIINGSNVHNELFSYSKESVGHAQKHGNENKFRNIAEHASLNLRTISKTQYTQQRFLTQTRRELTFQMSTTQRFFLLHHQKR